MYIFLDIFNKLKTAYKNAGVYIFNYLPEK